MASPRFFLDWLTTKSRARRSRRPNCQLRLEPLETRVLMAADFLSAVGLGNDVGDSSARGVATDAAGNTYMTGYFSGTVDFDPSCEHSGDSDVLTSAGGNDIFVAKYAPDNTLRWAMRMGGSTPNTAGATDKGQDIDVDASGNVYVTGHFQNTSDFGSVTLTSAGNNRDGFIAKLDSSGTVVWANRWGTTTGTYNSDWGSSIDTDANGNAFVVGLRKAENTTNTGGYDIRKYSANGSLVWAKYIQTNVLQNAHIAVSTSGNVFVAGNYSGSVDFDPGPKRKSAPIPWGFNAFVLKLNSSGNFQWVAPFNNSGSSYSWATEIALDGSGNLIVAGTFHGTVDFNPGSGTTYLTTSEGGFITKLNASGGLVWAKSLDGGHPSVTGLTTDAVGNIYATGYYQQTTDFDPGPGVASRTSTGGYDTFVLRMNSSGDFQWVEAFGGEGNDIGFGIAVDNTGTIHLAGEFGYLDAVDGYMVDFDPNAEDEYFLANSGAKRNVFLTKLRQS